MTADGDPARAEIVLYGDPRLRLICRTADPADPTLPGLIDRMRAVMRRHGGVGLAAPQVGDDRRVVLIRPPGDPEPLVLLNPVIASLSDDLRPFEEGCLSFPDIYRVVRRPSTATLHWTGTDGAPAVREDDDIFARIAQHEVDHLDGILFIDHLSPWGKFWVRVRMASVRRRMRGGDSR